MPTVQFRTNKRARRMRLSVTPAGAVIVTIPRRGSVRMARLFVSHHAAWIERALQRVERRRVTLPWKGTREEYLATKEQARALVEERLRFFNMQYGYAYTGISIRNQRTRWGSCSRHGRLNFNYRIAFLPPELVNYIIVHELCHLQQMNHSGRFWTLVSRTLPNYLQLRRTLHRSYPLH